MKSDRYFYSAASALILLVTIVGFFPFYTSGHGEGGRVIAPGLMPVVIAHGMAITAWFILSLVQSLAITVKNRKLHMKLGWTAVGFAPVIAVSGVMVAVLSTRGAPNFNFFGMRYHDFLLVMFAEMLVFAGLVTAGILLRKRPEIHRTLMLLASLSVLSGATVRMPPVVALFGGNSLPAFFGPVALLVVLLLLMRWAMTRSFDRRLAAGYAGIVVVYLAAEQVSRTEAWHQVIAGLFAK